MKLSEGEFRNILGTLIRGPGRRCRGIFEARGSWDACTSDEGYQAKTEKERMPGRNHLKFICFITFRKNPLGIPLDPY